MLLSILLGGVWPVVCVAGATFVVVRDHLHREASIQQADDYAHEAWCYLCEIRDVAEAPYDRLVAEDVDPALITGPIPPIQPNSLPFTRAQEYHSYGAGRQHLSDER